jgi:branched-chain amino acid transport system ATP-binding protein
VSAALSLHGVEAFYGRMPALHGVDLEVRSGQAVALLGANGAGKTTVLRAISRAVRTSGEIDFDGESIRRLSVDAAARRGIGHVPAGRGTFVELTVEENLRLGLLGRRQAAGAAADLDYMLSLFPVLGEMSNRRAGTLSGGQQQMLAIARALLARPSLLLLDEPSVGLAPLVAAEIFAALAELRREWSLSILIAEQSVGWALQLADYAYLLETGRIAGRGPSTEMKDDPAVRRAYLGD